MHRHISRLVQHKDILILIQDIQMQRHRNNRRLRSVPGLFRNKDPENIPLLKHRSAKSRLPVQQNRLLRPLHSSQYMFGKPLLSKKSKNIFPGIFA